MITVEEFAKILYEELEKDSWGDIDPDLFEGIAKGWDRPKNPEDAPDEDEALDYASLREVLQRASARLEDTFKKS